MGCWNKTCGLSKLHIYAGDPVYVFVLEQSDFRDRCYSTAFWRPLLVPFESVYNDYGGGENSSGVWFDHIMAGISKHLVEMNQGDNQYHDIPVKREGFGEEQFFDSVHEGRLNTSAYSREQSPVDFVMFRKDIVADILANYEIDRYVGNGKGNRPDADGDNCYLYYRWADVVADIPAFMDKLELDINASVDIHTEELKDSDYDDDRVHKIAYALATQMLSRSLGSVFNWEDTNKAAWYLYTEGYRFSGLVDVSGIIIKELLAGDRSKAEQMLEQHLLGCFLNSFLEHTRGMWLPGGHEGSQSCEPAGYIALANAVIKALATEDQRWD